MRSISLFIPQAVVDKNLFNVEQKVNEVCEIAQIMGRTDSKRQVGTEALGALKKAFAHLKKEKEKAVDYFARKRVEDIRNLEESVCDFEAGLGNLKTTFATHGPFTLSWKSHEALADLDVVLGKVEALKKTEKGILTEAAQLEIETRPSKELVNFGARVRKIYVIWEVVGEWESFQKKLLAKPVYPLERPAAGEEDDEQPAADKAKAQDSEEDAGEAIKKALEDIARKISDVVCDREAEDDDGDIIDELEIFISISGNVKSYREVMDLIARLKNESLRARHWMQVCFNCRFNNGPRNQLLLSPD
jgi:hypothetical protein